jgi:hypothetical protein
MDSNSWFIDVENILYKYDLANAYFYLTEQPLKKEKWNKLIKERISKEWIKKMGRAAPIVDIPIVRHPDSPSRAVPQ